MADLGPLLAPRSVAVVGATSRPGTYADETLRNLKRMGFAGRVWGVHPTRKRVHGRTCVPTVADLPEPVDAVVVAIPAPGVPEVIEQAGARGCGGAVVYGAGFGETPDGVALEDAVRAAAARHDLPVCGPNCDGIVSFPSRGALWGDALVPREAGPVALVSQSGNVAVNALASVRGLRLHTVVSCGNQAVVDASDWLGALAERDGVRSIALFLEADGDGARLCEALARCADAGVGVAVLKVGASAAGASAAAAHTGAVAGDHAAFRALIEEAGGAWADDVHDLLELAKALAVPGARSRARGGLAILTCSGGDSGLGADEAARLELDLPSLAPATRKRLSALLPPAATVANPLDYTALIWGEVETLRDTIAAVGEDPGIDHVLVFYDQPPGLEGAVRESWGQDAPYELADGTWDSRREEVARQFISLIDRFAPGFEDRLLAYEVLGPPDIEERIGLTGGNIFQGETTPDQMWTERLSPRTPVPGLYFCGAATHPGGSVIALNGRNAARAVLADALELAAT
jgi:acetate---CoA ligase (ADP-forming)